MFYRFLTCFLLAGSQAFSQGIPDINATQEASKKYIETRETRWPGYREDKALSQFMSRQYSPLTKAAMQNDVKAFMAIWSKLDERLRRFYATDYDFSNGNTPLHIAAGSTLQARKGRPDSSVIVKAICNYVDEQNLVNYEGDTPLMSSLGVEQDNFNIAEALIERCEADVNKQNLFGVSPLMLSALHGKTDFFKLLISKGADDWAKDGKEKGVYYYYNLGKVKGFFKKEEAKGITDWLESHGHDFYKEAISKCFGFSAEGGARTDEMRFYSFAETKSDMSNTFGYLVSQRKFISEVEKLERILKADCEAWGYRSCSPVRIPQFYEKEDYVATERITLTGQEGVIYYGLRPFIAGVMGSASGNPEECSAK